MTTTKFAVLFPKTSNMSWSILLDICCILESWLDQSYFRAPVTGDRPCSPPRPGSASSRLLANPIIWKEIQKHRGGTTRPRECNVSIPIYVYASGCLGSGLVRTSIAAWQFSPHRRGLLRFAAVLEARVHPKRKF